MTSESIARVQLSYGQVSEDARALSSRFYEELFRAAPAVRSLFPADLTALQGHFEAALALVIRNLNEMEALQQPLRDLGAQHIGWGAKPADYFVARDALVAAIRSCATEWSEPLEADWRRAITAIVVPMLQGAAVETALAAERIALDAESEAPGAESKQ
jgi:hemoglobin-like flavoprotein